jgi:hypothetical protein
MLDKSGNGNHATQATAARRPTYTEGGGLAWLAFDGVDDEMDAPALGVTSSALTMLYSATQSGGSAQDMIFGVENTTQNRFQNYTYTSGARKTGLRESGYRSIYTAYGDSSVNQIAGAVWNGSAVQNYINGATSGGASSLSGSMDLTEGVIYIGKSPSFSVVFSGIFRGGLLINRALSAEEVISFSAYLAAKSGVTL